MALKYELNKIKESIWKIKLSSEEASHITKHKKFIEVFWTEKESYYRLNPTTNALIFALNNIGIPQITPDNYLRVYVRISLIEKLHGAFLKESTIDSETRITINTDFFISKENIKNHIGLETNGRVLESAQFLKFLISPLKKLEL